MTTTERSPRELTPDEIEEARIWAETYDARKSVSTTKWNGRLRKVEIGQEVRIPEPSKKPNA